MDARTRREARIRRHRRVRKKVAGTAERPRLAVFRSNRHIYAQLIDDLGGRTLAAASDLDPALPTPAAMAKAGAKGAAGEGEGAATDPGKTGRAKAVGSLLAERAKEAGIEQAVFDRGGRLYRGRVAALADGAREGGLKI